MIQLHCFGESGNAYKAALTLELSGLEWEPVKVDFFGGATRDPDWRKGNGITRFLMNFLPEDKRNPDVIGFMQGRCKAAFDVLNTHLTDRDWIVGDEITTADIANCSYLYYPEPFGFERKDWPNIDRWLDNISNTPGWKHPYDLMPGSPADRT